MDSAAAPITKPRRRLEVAGIVLGSLLTLSPLAGFFATIRGMLGAFSTLGHEGIADPKALSGEIAHTLFWTMIGITLCPLGVILLTISIVLYTRPRRPVPPPLS